jgi:hypothetical protein
MSTQAPWQPLLVAYDRERARELLRTWTAQSLRDALRSGHFGADLLADERAELDALLTAWVQRALGYVFLRDALLVDEQRGPRVFGLICSALTIAQVEVSPELLAALRARGPAELTPADLADLAAQHPNLTRLIDLAGSQGLAIALIDVPAVYPPLTDLVSLLPIAALRRAYADDRFVPPTGLRRNIAVVLALGGIALLLVPMLSGSIPERPAGLPLALITLALMVGIRAGWAGYLGAICLWLVPNLPGFRYGQSLSELMPYLPLLVAGLALFIADRRVRALWVWVRGQIGL